jgi:transposase
MDGLAHALYLFALGVPACRAQWYLPIKSRSTVERSFLVFRLAIHDASISDMEQASRELGMDPIPSDSHRSLKQSWGNREKCVVFGISRKECKDEGRRGWQVLTFPVPKLPNCLLKDLIKGPLKTGGVHYVDDSHGYVVLKMGARNERIAIKGGKNDRGRRRLDWIDGFLGFARIWLEHYRGVFQEYFPLYLKEIELRFNHNHDPKELFPLVARMIVRRDM